MLTPHYNTMLYIYIVLILFLLPCYDMYFYVLVNADQDEMKPVLVNIT